MEQSQAAIQLDVENVQFSRFLELGFVKAVDPKTHSVAVESSISKDIYPMARIMGRVYWNLQVNDVVVLAFLEGKMEKPIVLGKLIMNDDHLISDSQDNDIHLRHTIKDRDGNITGIIGIQTDKDGNLTVTLMGNKANFILNTLGDEGNVYINVKGGIAFAGSKIDMKLGVNGLIEINLGGKLSINATDDIRIQTDESVNIAAKNAKIEVTESIIINGAEININNGEKGVARLNDSIESNMQQDSTFWNWIAAAGAALTGLGVTVPIPTSLEGIISESSETVKAGD